MLQPHHTTLKTLSQKVHELLDLTTRLGITEDEVRLKFLTSTFVCKMDGYMVQMKDNAMVEVCQEHLTRIPAMA